MEVPYVLFLPDDNEVPADVVRVCWPGRKKRQNRREKNPEPAEVQPLCEQGDGRANDKGMALRKPGHVPDLLEGVESAAFALGLVVAAYLIFVSKQDGSTLAGSFPLFIRQVLLWPFPGEEAVKTALPVWMAAFFVVKAVAAAVPRTSFRALWSLVAGFVAIFYPVVAILVWPVAIWDKVISIACWLALAIPFGTRLLEL